jgi:hypothetical protein
VRPVNPPPDFVSIWDAWLCLAHFHDVVSGLRQSGHNELGNGFIFTTVTNKETVTVVIHGGPLGCQM